MQPEMCKSKYYKEACFTHRKDPGKLWNTINEVSSRNPQNSIVKNLKVGQQELTSSIDIAEAFNEHFSTVGKKLASKIESSNVKKSFHEYLPTTNTVFGIEPTCPARVLKLLLKLSDKKPTGLNGISSQLIKISAPYIANSITNIFSCAISMGIFPDEWKSARVTPVFKNGSPSDVNIYRSVSITPVKKRDNVFEKILYDQLYKYLSDNNLLSNCQSGFRTLHSTVTTLLNSTDNRRFSIDKGKINWVVFVDLQKAFDTVDHSILISKMERYGLNELALTLFSSYLENRSQIKLFCLSYPTDKLWSPAGLNPRASNVSIIY